MKNQQLKENGGNDLLLPENCRWDEIYILPYKISKDTNLRWFQTRLIHRILSTNKFLCKIGIRSDDRCSFCSTDPETLKHLFWECNVVQTFWKTVETWLKADCTHILDLNISYRDIILGIQERMRAVEIINLIILTAKQSIYNKKYQNSIPLLVNFKKIFLGTQALIYLSTVTYKFHLIL